MLKIESEREEDGRWIAEVPALPGVLTYGANEAEAVPRLWPWRFGSSRTGSRTVSRCHAKSQASSKLHEFVVLGKGASAYVLRCCVSDGRSNVRQDLT
jgi:hypothetical protein